MSTNTENYNLIKPDQEDFYNVDDFNNNADIIDSQLKTLSDKATAALPATSYTAADILNKLKTVDGVNSGLDADLFKGQSVIPVVNGGTGATTASSALGNLMNSTKGILDDYAQMDFGIYQSVYSGLKENDPFTNTGSKRITAICFSGSAASEKVVIAMSVDGGNTGLTFIGHVSSAGISWVRLVDLNSLNSLMQSALQSGGVSVVKSVQRGTITIPYSSGSATATISSVNVNKAVVLYTGMNAGTDGLGYYPSLQLLDSTTINATRRTTSSSNTNATTTIPYQVIEFY